MDDRQDLTPESLGVLAQTYEQRGAQCREIGAYLKRQADTAYWQSKAARTFKDEMGVYQKALSDFETAFRALAQDLRRRKTVLEQSQNV